MAGKRRATSELNRDNWDKDEPAEESGVYTKASEELLKKRVFKTAKRRITKPPEEGSMNAFNPASLANLTSKSHQPANQLFSFLSDMKPEASKTNGMNTKSTNQGDGKSDSFSLFTFGNKIEKTENNSPFGNNAKKSEDKSGPMFSFGDNNSKGNDKVISSVPSFIFGNIGDPLSSRGNKKDEITTQKEKISENVDDYYAKLKGLNESVAKWIAKHVEDNPLINLQPIFKDYDKFFDEIEKEYHKSDSCGIILKSDAENQSKKTSTIPKQPETVVTSTPLDTFKFSSTSVEKTVSSSKIDLPTTSIFKFGNTVATTDKNSSEKVESSTPSTLFKFGAANTSFSKTEQSSFKFETSASNDAPNTIHPPKYSFGGSGSGFTGLSFASSPISTGPSTINFGSIPSNASNTEENKDEEESEEPPKVEIKEVEEEGQIYTIRCKLFVKKDGTFIEKGVGNLFLKPVPESDKIQVIVRAHNSLANVLCNFILSKSIPTQRMGKNNVMIVCIPTPESKPPPIPVLIKVKTGEDADQLLETLEKHKK